MLPLLLLVELRVILSVLVSVLCWFSLSLQASRSFVLLGSVGDVESLLGLVGTLCPCKAW